MSEKAPKPSQMDRFQRFLFLRTMPALAEVPPEVSQVIAANTRERFFAEGEYLYRSGVPALEIQYVVSGECEIVRNGRAVRRLGARSVVGGVSALAGEELGYDCIALEDMVTLAIAVEDSQEIFEDHFVLLKRVLRGTSREVLESRRKLGQSAGFGPVAKPFAFPDRPFDLVERMAFLRKTLSFGDSEIDAIADLARDVQEVHLPKGEVLWNVGDRSTYFLLPLRGVVDCQATDPDQHFQLGPSDSVGAIDAMADERRWFRAEVLEDLVAFRIDQESLLELLEDHFAMAMSLLKSMAAGILHLYDHGHSPPS
ncbi:MAG: cyclic nucleotide-binding domain-containing protein [Deltaproteobacteria bacterium]|nr:cyclic nucleotide-binding domain-containing protein [Deltaproteobacteria bacterium]MBW2210062.1 cyclic nucleotide-binding domain-containing protein [Deltaproteobacteria bacterium]MBW2213439.1 cyclic nucleotide-binding domain-containing protein [Deltaproteobacteria bacterium]MBW2379228.1 cyclic nucleotide-binding domain-containing protein [Deltaproteobacteria bacterium]MBW2551437.1 cyclic nucleotide-binding domain-containing protein [Deltaproteobacteria bacterium]